MIPPFPRLVLVWLASVSFGACFAHAQGATSSPFAPTAVSAATAGAPQATTHELVGILATSKQVRVGITDTATHRSFWIPVGKSAEGVEVVSCDPSGDRAVVRIGGELKTLVMHAKSAPASGGPAAPMATNFAPPPTTANAKQIAEQEKEARMLVSDLLEIGIQQRKAYEAAQREAAAKAAQKPGALPVTQTIK